MRRILTSLALACGIALPAAAQDRPVVVELFTSQGCSSCPPADALLHDLAKDPNIVALALHVDYWDYIGWKDSFASPEYTERQRNYARVQSERMVYTPQMMINGIEHVVGNRAGAVKAAIERHSRSQTVGALDAELDGRQLTINVADASVDGPFIIHLVSYAPSSRVDIRRGENAGRTIDYANVVTDWRSIAEWSGASAREFNVTITSLPAVVLLQRKGYGEIFDAVRIGQ